MTTAEAWLHVLWARFSCRRLGRHSGRVWIRNGYSVSYCYRCYAHRVVEVARWG